MVGLFSTSTMASQVSCQQSIDMKIRRDLKQRASTEGILVDLGSSGNSRLLQATVNNGMKKFPAYIVVKFGPQGTCTPIQVFFGPVPQ